MPTTTNSDGSPPVRLESARTKLRRAEEHLRELDNEVAWWVARKPYRVVGEPNEDLSEHVLRFHFDQRPDTDRWSAIVGDIAHNLRSVLDHIVWQYAEDRADRRHEWPIFADGDDYNAVDDRGQPQRWSGLRKIIGVTNDGVRELIDQMQPYHRGDQAKKESLWLLYEVDNADKHRAVHPVLILPATVNFDGMFLFKEEPPDGEKPFDEVFVLDPVEHGAVFATITARYPVERVKMNYNIALQISLDVRPLDVTTDPFLPLTGTLAQLTYQVGAIVEAAEQRSVVPAEYSAHGSTS